MTTTYLALLRGINVGGRNRIVMTELRDAFGSAGLTDVRTYIASGNVIFGSDATDPVVLTDSIERLLAERFDYAARVTLRDRDELRSIVGAAPVGFGTEPDVYRYDVMFLLGSLTAAEAVSVLTLRDGVDAAWEGPGAVYFSRLSAQLSSSGLSRIVSTPAYQQMTIRSWNTTTKLLQLMES